MDESSGLARGGIGGGGGMGGHGGHAMGIRTIRFFTYIRLQHYKKNQEDRLRTKYASE